MNNYTICYSLLNKFIVFFIGSVNNKKSKQIPTSESQADSSEEEYESAEERQHKTGTKNKKQSKRSKFCLLGKFYKI